MTERVGKGKKLREQRSTKFHETRGQFRFRVERTLADVTPGNFLFGFFALLCLFLILKTPDNAIRYVHAGLRLCAKTIIPTLFPFMVLSELIVSGGTLRVMAATISSPFRKLFRLPEAGCCAVLLGMICGFPIGARCAMIAYREGQLSREETERVLAFSNMPSSGFLITAVGVSLWGNRAFGIALYVSVLLSATVTGILFAHLPKRGTSVAERIVLAPTKERKGVTLFTEAVRSSGQSMLTVCCYVIFFSALMGTLRPVTDALRLPESVCAAIGCSLELSGGMSLAAGLTDPQIAAMLCAFAAGWSGLSVHCQVISVCDGYGLRFRLYFLGKLLQSSLCPLFFFLFTRLCPKLLIPAQQAIGWNPEPFRLSLFSVACLLSFAVALMLCGWRFLSDQRKGNRR